MKFETFRWVLKGIGSSVRDSTVYLVWLEEVRFMCLFGSIAGMLNSLLIPLEKELSKLVLALEFGYLLEIDDMLKRFYFC